MQSKKLADKYDESTVVVMN